MTTTPNDPKLDEAIEWLTGYTSDEGLTDYAKRFNKDKNAYIKTVIAEISRMKEQQPERVTVEKLADTIELAMFEAGCFLQKNDKLPTHPADFYARFVAKELNNLIITDGGE